VPLLPAADLRNADAADDVDDDDDDDGTDERGPLAPMLSMLEPHLPQLGAFLYTKFVEFFRQVPPATTPPAATSSPAPTTPASVSTAPRVVVQSVDVAAGYESADVAFETELFETASINNELAPEPADDVATVDMPEVAPTAAQLTHLFAVRERLSPPEQTLVEHVIKRMPTELLTQYLRTLSSLSIDDATTFIRSLIAQARPEHAMSPR
ncbi:MAG: hypothetical protein ABI175_07120, partial [Polyangiales bacterium]